MIKIGIGCSPGIVSGQAFMLQSYNSDIQVPANSILVVKRSSPEFILPLMHAKGIICEIGGRMSHLAMLCRELGKPCVMGIDNIYSFINNGYFIVIDGDTGKVIINE